VGHARRESTPLNEHPTAVEAFAVIDRLSAQVVRRGARVYVAPSARIDLINEDL